MELLQQGDQFFFHQQIHEASRLIPQIGWERECQGVK